MKTRAKILLSVTAALAFAGAVWLWSGRVRDPGAPVRVAVTAEPADSGWLVESVVIETAGGLSLSCATRRPAPAVPGEQLEAALVAGGYGTGKRAALIVGSSFRGVALACDYPWRNPGRYSAVRLALRLPWLRSELVSTPLAYRAAATWLLSRPDVDSARLVGIGVSLGVPMVASWAADDARVKAVALLYGGARLDVLLERAAQRAWWPASVRNTLAPVVARSLAPLEPERIVPRLAPRPVFVAVSHDDERIPRESADALVAAAGTTAHVVRLEGRHVMPRADALLGALTDSTVAWLSRTLNPPAGSR